MTMNNLYMFLETIVHDTESALINDIFYKFIGSKRLDDFMYKIL